MSKTMLWTFRISLLSVHFVSNSIILWVWYFSLLSSGGVPEWGRFYAGASSTCWCDCWGQTQPSHLLPQTRCALSDQTTVPIASYPIICRQKEFYGPFSVISCSNFRWCSGGVWPHQRHGTHPNTGLTHVYYMFPYTISFTMKHASSL